MVVVEDQLLCSSPMRWKTTFDQALKQCNPLKIGLAVSGGPDSMALAWLTSRWLKENVNHSLHGQLICFTVDHNARPQSTVEAYTVGTWLKQMDPAIHHRVLSVKWPHGVPHSQFELQARNARRQLLVQACRDLGLSYVLTGHTLNDQLETFIMRLIKGSSLFGLSGMDVKSIADTPNPCQAPVYVIKPLLQYSKRELIDICRANGVRWVEDPTNTNPTFTVRNSIRALFGYKLPEALRPASLRDTIDILRQRRARIKGQAAVVISGLKKTGHMVINRKLGTAELREYPSLSGDSMMQPQVFGHMLEHIAPVDEFSYRRSSLHRLCMQMASLQAQDPQRAFTLTWLGTRIDVTPQVSSDMLYTYKCYRQRPFSYENTSMAIECTPQWSDWMLFDNRFWIRLRSASDRVTVVCRLLHKPSTYKSLLSKALQRDRVSTKIRWPSAKVLYGQPLLFIAQDSMASTMNSSMDSSTIIGFPTLQLINPQCGVEVKCHLKSSMIES